MEAKNLKSLRTSTQYPVLSSLNLAFMCRKDFLRSVLFVHWYWWGGVIGGNFPFTIRSVPFSNACRGAEIFNRVDCIADLGRSGEQELRFGNSQPLSKLRSFPFTYNKKVSYRKQIAHQHSCHKYLGQGMDVVDPLKLVLSSSYHRTQFSFCLSCCEWASAGGPLSNYFRWGDRTPFG